MKTADQAIHTIADVICTNIAFYNNDSRGLLSQNILSQLRNLLEHISLKIYGNSLGQDLPITYDYLKKGVNMLKVTTVSINSYPISTSIYKYQHLITLLIRETQND